MAEIAIENVSKIFAGLEEVTSGRIVIGGRDVTDAAPRDRDIAMVFQNYALYPHMTVRQNLGYGLKVRKTSKDEIARRVEEVARMLRLDELLERRPAALSGGQPLSASRRRFSWTSRSRTSTRSCGFRCARNSRACTRG